MMISLVGYMGCGKSRIAREAAKACGFSVADTDKIIEEEQKLSVAEIFDKFGEPYFRHLETELIERFAGMEANTIIATGGGVPCFNSNMELLNGLGSTIYLKMSPANLVKRILPGIAKRPLLRGVEPASLEDHIHRQLLLREPFYSQASMIIDCDGVSDKYISQHIENFIQYLVSSGHRI